MMFSIMKDVVAKRLYKLVQSDFELKPEAAMYLRYSEFSNEIYHMLKNNLREKDVCTFSEFESTIEQLETGFLVKL